MRARRTASLAGLLLLAACGSSTHAAPSLSTADGSAAATASAPAPVAADPSAEAALATWSSFPVDADPRPVVLVEDPVTSTKGFRTGDAKIAFISGSYAEPASLPGSPATQDGRTLITAREALARLRASGTAQPQLPAPAPLAITGVTLGQASFRTDRGTVPLPVWSFTVKDGLGPISVLALTPEAYVVTPDKTPAGVTVTGLDTTSRTLTVTYRSGEGSGPCAVGPVVASLGEETRTAVVVDLVAGPLPTVTTLPPTGAVVCDANIGPTIEKSSTLTLAAPLGNRVVVDDYGNAAIATP